MDGVAVSLFVAYMIVMLFIGYIGLKRSKGSEDFFVAGRKVGPLMLFFTFAATNFSAFFFFGFAGAAYTSGFAYYGIMAIGTSLMALSFYLLGRRIWRVGRAFKLITPPELFAVRFQSQPLRITMLSMFVLFTLPYVATQAIGGGIALNTLTDGAISFEIGAVIVTSVIVAYLLMGGMVSDVLSDLLQGIMMSIVALAAVGFVTMGLGGFETANHAVYLIDPSLFSLPGAAGLFTIQIWISYILLWTFCDPMFPHLFQRFYVARDEKSIRFSMLAYPVITTLLFLFPVLMGVWGHVGVDLGSNSTDSILPMMIGEYAPSWLFALVMAGGFAALMSTADSQLLVLSSMLTRDVCGKIWKDRTTPEREVKVGRILIFVLALVSLAIALSSFVSIFELLTKTTFTGLAILFPATVAALYWKKATAWGCISSVVVGEGLYALFFFNVLPSELTLGFLPAIPLVGISALVLILVSMITKKPSDETTNEFFSHIETK